MAQSRSDAAWGPPSPSTDNGGHMQDNASREPQDDPKPGTIRRVSRHVVPGLPRAQTFKRQRSEVRDRLEPVRPTPAERRAVSMDRRAHDPQTAVDYSDPRTSAPDFLHHPLSDPSSPSLPMSPPENLFDGRLDGFDLAGDSIDGSYVRDADTLSRIDVRSMTTSQYDALIESELERKWILNLSMHFRDKSKREKFFVTFRQHEHHWRRVTVSLDYRNAPEDSLEAELAQPQPQRDKSAKIYDAIRDSLSEIDFYDTVTNLKLETKDGRLHVHVVEDVNEIISFPPVRMIQHMECRRIKEREIHFDSHMSGFVYKVRVHGRLLIKKEIPGPETVDEFLYEINALSQLSQAEHVIQFYGIVVDDREERVTGLLISYAARGALIDIIYEANHGLSWPVREKWARQIVGGLAEIHEAGFVQGDFTLSNIVVDANDDAKIIDINRRGCPIGWEPPEVTPLIDSNQRISMYIGVKSDLYQLGMVLWALAMQEDEPDAHGRPLMIDPRAQVPAWYRQVVDTCLSANPRDRIQAAQLLSWFPDPGHGSQHPHPNGSSVSLNGDGHARHGYLSPAGIPRIKGGHTSSDWAFVGLGNHHLVEEPFYYPSRGRSPPSPMPSDEGQLDHSRFPHRMYTWSDTFNRVPAVPSVSDVLARDARGASMPRLQGSEETLETYADGPYRVRVTDTETSQDDESFIERGRSLSRRGDYGRDNQAMTAVPAAWGPPPDQWRTSGSHAYHESKGNTGPGSQADSGKDVTEMASTPRGSRGYPAAVRGQRYRSVSRGRRGRSSTESAARQSTQPTALVSTASNLPSKDQPNGDSNDGRDTDSGCRDPAGTDTLSQGKALATGLGPAGKFSRPDDDLKGIGSAYGPAPGLGASHCIDDDLDEKRPRDAAMDDELAAGMDQSMRGALGPRREVSVAVEV